jgi:hypothetical protein
LERTGAKPAQRKYPKELRERAVRMVLEIRAAICARAPKCRQATGLIGAATGELLRELTLDPGRNYQPTGRKPKTP